MTKGMLTVAGSDFFSVRQASPLLERSGCGISALWSRTVALKYDCSVVVGYPERSEASTTDFTTVSGIYNSALVINGEGETIVNYRKKLLHPAERIWASDSHQDFFFKDVKGLGRVAMGISTDLKFVLPHVLPAISS
jgi:protein N-terminal amidase